ncbi:MAG: hypothetical protein ACN2B6_00030 [Rickettsiales bacterium]
MAAGDVVFFDQWLVDVQEGVHNMETDTIKVGFTIGTTTPTATTADPRWGAGGTTNFSSEEVTPGGNYTAGGPTIANNSVTLTGGAGVFDGDDISILQNGSNPTNARWGIIYNDTATGKNALGFVDFGSAIDLSSGDFSIAWNASGIESMNQA